MKNRKSTILTVVTSLAWGGFIVSILLIIIYLTVIISSESFNLLDWNSINKSIANQFNKNIGDFLWGTLGITLTFTATAFLFVTFKEQRHQLNITRQEADKVRFETTYFNILSMLKQVQDTVNSNIFIRLGDKGVCNIIEYYSYFIKFYQTKLESDSNLKTMSMQFRPLTANQSEIEQYRESIAAIYEQMVNESDCNIGYLYRYLFNAIKFVVDDPYNKEDEHARCRYLNLLQSQLSNEELCLLFYNALSKYGQDKDGHLQFKKMLDFNNFLENIDQTFLLNANQYIFYPHTRFKFLNREQLKHVTPCPNM